MTSGAARPAEPHVEGRVRLSDGRALGFAMYGAKRGRAVFWFHGTPGGRHQIPPMAARAAAERSVRLIALERPGAGRSTPHLYRTVLDWAGDVEQVADRLDAERFALVGLSGGAPYVMACAHRLPSRVVAGALLGTIAPTRGEDAASGGAVGLAATALPLLEAARAPLELALWGAVRGLAPLASLGFDAFLGLMPEGDRAVFRRPEIKAMFIGDILAASRRRLAAPVCDVILFGRDWGFALDEVRRPIRLWHGDADNISPLAHAEHVAGRLRDAELRVRPDQGHIGTLDAAEEVLEALLALWDSEADGAHPSVPSPRTESARRRP